jgi:1-deoxy-D-xylulose-5-phosphate synthase
MHTVSPSGPSSGRTWTDVFADELLAIGEARPDVVALTAAMPGPTGLRAFGERWPSRFVDVGIAEQHAVTCAAGLAMGGLHPVVAIYATFLNRAFDQVLMDVGLHRLPVTFVLDRAGVTGSDGPSHHGMWDLTLLGTVPGMRVAAPRDGDALRALLREAVAVDGPTAVRFPKSDVGPPVPAVDRLGGCDVLRRGTSVLVVAAGACGAAACAAADELAATGVDVMVVDPRWLLPVDPALVAAAGDRELVVTVEDNGGHGGYGDAFARALRAAGVSAPLRTLSLAQRYLPHGSRGAILSEHGLDGPGVAAAVRATLG